jgi:hypothetical protein
MSHRQGGGTAKETLYYYHLHKVQGFNFLLDKALKRIEDKKSK